jgi:hypothetical protein
MADKKITRNRPTNYPRQIVILATDELADDVAETAQREGVSKAEVARRWIEGGRADERRRDV